MRLHQTERLIWCLILTHANMPYCEVEEEKTHRKKHHEANQYQNTCETTSTSKKYGSYPCIQLILFCFWKGKQIYTQQENTGISSSYTFVSKPGNHNNSHDLSHGARFHINPYVTRIYIIYPTNLIVLPCCTQSYCHKLEHPTTATTIPGPQARLCPRTHGALRKRRSCDAMLSCGSSFSNVKSEQLP